MSSSFESRFRRHKIFVGVAKRVCSRSRGSGFGKACPLPLEVKKDFARDRSEIVEIKIFKRQLEAYISRDLTT